MSEYSYLIYCILIWINPVPCNRNYFIIRQTPCFLAREIFALPSPRPCAFGVRSGSLLGFLVGGALRTVLYWRALHSVASHALATLVRPLRGRSVGYASCTAGTRRRLGLCASHNPPTPGYARLFVWSSPSPAIESCLRREVLFFTDFLTVIPFCIFRTDQIP